MDFPNCSQLYSTHLNAWINNERFVDCLFIQYESIRERSNGPWLLLLESLSGHENLPILLNGNFLYLSENKTSLYQPMDQGIIQMLKNSYRTNLLLEYLLCLLQYTTSGNSNKTTQIFQKVRSSVHEGRTAHVKDAIRIANRGCADVPDSIIENCWKKSTCLGGNRQEGLDTNYNVQNEFQRMIEIRNENLVNFPSVLNPIQVLTEFLNSMVDDVMQYHQEMLLEEILERKISVTKMNLKCLSISNEKKIKILLITPPKFNELLTRYKNWK